MEKSYKVAGHVFILVLPDGLENTDVLLKNYEPFEMDRTAEEPIFTVVLEEGVCPYEVEHVSEAIECGRLKALYTGQAEPKEPKLDVYENEAGNFQIEMAVFDTYPSCASLVIRKDCKYAHLYLKKKKYLKFAINNSSMMLYAFSTSKLNTLEMHSSVIVNGGRAVMNLGRSGAGKSTHSRMWLENIEGTELMNDDNPIVRISDKGEIIAYGSPWSGKTPCYKNMCAPVSAFVNILQYPSNNIEKCSILQTYASIYAAVSGFKFMEDHVNGLYSTINRIMESVPCYDLQCLPDGDAARLCKRTVFNEQ